MGEIQPIIHDGRLAAIVVGEQAIVPDTLADSQLLPVSAKCCTRSKSRRGASPAPTPIGAPRPTRGRPPHNATKQRHTTPPRSRRAEQSELDGKAGARRVR
jgi:hypothetical protein